MHFKKYEKLIKSKENFVQTKQECYIPKLVSKFFGKDISLSKILNNWSNFVEIRSTDIHEQCDIQVREEKNQQNQYIRF